MSWCPKCGTEYMAGINICADCHELLQNQAPVSSKSLDGERLVLLMPLESEVQAAILQDILQQDGIESKVQTFQPDDQTLGFGPKRWNYGELLVLESDYENAKFIATEYLNTLDNGIPNEDEQEWDEDQEDEDEEEDS